MKISVAPKILGARVPSVGPCRMIDAADPDEMLHPSYTPPKPRYRDFRFSHLGQNSGHELCRPFRLGLNARDGSLKSPGQPTRTFPRPAGRSRDVIDYLYHRPTQSRHSVTGPSSGFPLSRVPLRTRGPESYSFTSGSTNDIPPRPPRGVGGPFPQGGTVYSGSS